MGKSIPIPKQLALPLMAAFLLAPVAGSYVFTALFDNEHVSRGPYTTAMTYIRGDFFRARLKCPGGSRWIKFRALDRDEAVAFVGQSFPKCRITRLRLSDMWN